jgi:hypothetical protein
LRTEQNHVVETAVEARAGFFDSPVLIVQAVSCVLVVVRFVPTDVGVIKI